MERTDQTETRDFMNVDSFSQLPFIRPAAPAKDKGGIRLFGIEFGGADAPVTDESESTETNHSIEKPEGTRKFECHYCCRNFPTSQALGGHQNAHKRERQHAKRAHLQTAMAVHSGLSEAPIYGLMNYQRLPSSLPATPALMTYYNSWNNTNCYGSTQPPSFSRPPVTGNPLPRIPVVHNSTTFNPDRPMHPLFTSDDLRPAMVGSSNSQSQYLYESKPSPQDHQVSLDLHL